MLAILGGEVVTIAAFVAAKLGTVRESLAVLKTFNMLQACTAAAVSFGLVQLLLALSSVHFALAS